MLWLCWWVELAIVNNSSCHKAAICIKYEFFLDASLLTGSTRATTMVKWTRVLFPLLSAGLDFLRLQVRGQPLVAHMHTSLQKMTCADPGGLTLSLCSHEGLCFTNECGYRASLPPSQVVMTHKMRLFD